MQTLIVSTIAFFAAGYFIRRRLDAMGIPKGMTRNVLVFSLALAVSYAVAAAADRLIG